MLASIGANYHWSQAEIEALTVDKLRFYGGAMGELIERTREQT